MKAPQKKAEELPGRPTAREVVAAFYPEHDAIEVDPAAILSDGTVRLPVFTIPGPPSEFSGEFYCLPYRARHTPILATTSGKDFLVECSCGSRLLISATRIREANKTIQWVRDGLRNVPSKLEEANA